MTGTAAATTKMSKMRMELPARASDTAGHEPVEVVFRPGVADLLRNWGEEAVSVELTLEFGCLVVKHAVAYAGASEPAFGYSKVRVGDVDVWWRQRLAVPGREPVLSTSVRPRRVVLERVGRTLSAAAAYA